MNVFAVHLTLILPLFPWLWYHFVRIWQLKNIFHIICSSHFLLLFIIKIRKYLLMQLNKSILHGCLFVDLLSFAVVQYYTSSRIIHTKNVRYILMFTLYILLSFVVVQDVTATVTDNTLSYSEKQICIKQSNVSRCSAPDLSECFFF